MCFMNYELKNKPWSYGSGLIRPERLFLRVLTPTNRRIRWPRAGLALFVNTVDQPRSQALLLGCSWRIVQWRRKREPTKPAKRPPVCARSFHPANLRDLRLGNYCDLLFFRYHWGVYWNNLLKVLLHAVLDYFNYILMESVLCQFLSWHLAPFQICVLNWRCDNSGDHY